jgi:hypothetical protein
MAIMAVSAIEKNAETSSSATRAHTWSQSGNSATVASAGLHGVTQDQGGQRKHGDVELREDDSNGH